MIKTIIKAFPTKSRQPEEDNSPILNVAECFSDTIQGENFVGQPATFLRLQGCTLQCIFCDTAEVWRQGNKYTVKELLKIFEDQGVIQRLQNGQHLVLTGGSPLKQQDSLCSLIAKIIVKYKFKPLIEIENECTIMPNERMFTHVNRWNNSPKLANSGMKKELTYKPEIIRYLSSLEDSWFKFVISNEDDWKEIEKDYLKPKLIMREQIVLMPEGQTRIELQQNYEKVVNICVRENLRMTDRLHVTIWNKTVGV